MENKTWTYADRYRHIKEVKIRHTEEKRIQQGGFMNADDYGNVPLLGGEFCRDAGDSSHLCGSN